MLLPWRQPSRSGALVAIRRAIHRRCRCTRTRRHRRCLPSVTAHRSRHAVTPRAIPRGAPRRPNTRTFFRHLSADDEPLSPRAPTGCEREGWRRPNPLPPRPPSKILAQAERPLSQGWGGGAADAASYGDGTANGVCQRGHPKVKASSTRRADISRRDHGMAIDDLMVEASGLRSVDGLGLDRSKDKRGTRVPITGLSHRGRRAEPKEHSTDAGALAGELASSDPPGSGMSPLGDRREAEALHRRSMWRASHPVASHGAGEVFPGDDGRDRRRLSQYLSGSSATAARTSHVERAVRNGIRIPPASGPNWAPGDPVLVVMATAAFL